MPANAGTVNITLRVKDDGSVVIDRFGKGVEKQAKGVDKSMRQAAGGALALKTAIAGAAVAMAVAYDRAVDSASDLQEAQSKFDVVFRGQRALAEEWADALVDGYAMSMREADQYLSSIQDLLVPMGMAADSAGLLSNQVVQLAVDLGSFNNQSTSKVMEDYESALVGNYETMKKYGVVLNETTVQAEALAMGLAASKEAITASDKAQAAHNIILRSSAAAIGDMARTSDGYANTTKRLDSEWEDFASTLGEKFLPTATKIKGVTADILDNLTKAIQGPSLDDQIAAVEERLDILRRSEQQRLAEAEKRRQAFNERERQAIDSSRSQAAMFMGNLDVPTDYMPSNAVAFQKKYTEELHKSKSELALENAERDLAYLLDVKRFKLLEDHKDRMSGPVTSNATTIEQGPQNDAHIKSYQEELVRRMGLLAEFNDEYKQLVLSRTAYESMQIDAMGRKYVEAGADEIEVARWVADQKRLVSDQWRDGAIRALDDYGAAAMDAAANTESLFSNALGGIEDAFVRLKDTGKLAFGEMVDSMINDIIRLSVRMSITGPMAEALSAGFASYFGGWAGTGTGSYSSADGSFSSTYATYNRHGNVYGPFGLHAFARGGIVDRPTMFRFGQGGAFSGVMGEAGSEGILPLGRTKSGDLGVKTTGGYEPVVNVTIINRASGAQGTVTSQTANASGGVDIEVLVDQIDGALAQKAATNRSALDRVQANKYGLSGAHGTVR